MRTRISLRGRLLRRGSLLLALLNPSIQIARGPRKRVNVQGPKGEAQFTGRLADNLDALSAIGALLYGSPESIRAVDSLLADPRTSCSTAYFCAVAPDCDGIAGAWSRLRAATVSIVGCGGLGSHTAVLLAGAGVGHLRIVDHDRIEASNLNRQLFWTLADLGKYKVEVLGRCLRERFPDVEVMRVKTRVTTRSLTTVSNGSDLIVVTADTPAGLATRARLDPNSPDVLIGGYHFHQGFVGWRPRKSLPNAKAWERLPRSIMPSVGPLNAQISGLLASAVVGRLTRLWSVDARLGISWSSSKYPPRMRAFRNDA